VDAKRGYFRQKTAKNGPKTGQNWALLFTDKLMAKIGKMLMLNDLLYFLRLEKCRCSNRGGVGCDVFPPAEPGFRTDCLLLAIMRQSIEIMRQ
jgi:hypothetical protein